MTVTLRDLAESLHLSVTTISRALAGYPDVAEKTRLRVEKTAKEMGYYPNLTARQLQKQQTDTLAFIIPTHGPRFSDPFFSELLAGIGNEAGRHRYDVLVSTQSPGSESELEAYRRVVNGRRADGVLVVRTRQNDKRIRFLCQYQFPFVAFGRSDLDLEFPYVDEDGYAGICQLVQYIIDLGHRRIGFIRSPFSLMFSRLRWQGYLDTLEKNGIEADPALVVEGDLTQRGGFQAANRLLALAERPTAIVACNDLMAMGTMSAAQQLGLLVGRDLSVGGFDDIPLAEHAHTPLTTLQQPIYEIGQRITRMLVDLIIGKKLLETRVMLTPKLIIRDSIGPPEGI